MFQVGEHVMYRNIGICEVEAIGKIGFSSDKEKDYYTLRPLCATNNSRFYVPVGASASMRNIISRQEGIFQHNNSICVCRPLRARRAAAHAPDALYVFRVYVPLRSVRGSMRRTRAEEMRGLWEMVSDH